MKKLFAPDLMLNNYVKSCWHRNIKTNDAKKVPIQEELKVNGIYAIEIEPAQLTNDNYWAIGFPLNSAWEDEEPVAQKRVLSFECVVSTPMVIAVKFQSTDGAEGSSIVINNTDSWKEYIVDIPKKLIKFNLVVLSGPILDSVLLLKNVVLT